MGNQSTLPWGVAVVLVIAYALFSTSAPAPAQAPQAPPASGPAHNEPFSLAANPKDEGAFACLDVPPPLRPACRQLTQARTISGEQGSAPGTESPAPKPWESQPWVQRAHAGMKVVIALVPDPELTRLALYYGRTIDSIILAAGRTNFLFDSYWMPWKAASARSAADTAKGLPPLVPPGLDPPATLPGALLFRQSSASWEPAAATNGPAYLMVLLVGESNISGLRPNQFAEALYYLRTLNPGATTVPILGPSYSGTFASLHKILREDDTAHPGTHYRIVSSNTTVKEARRQIRLSPPEVSLTAIQRDDESTLNALLRGVGPQRLGAIAMLSEGDTAFGSAEITQWGKDADAPRITRISFPRGIAQLRDVYPEDTPAKTPTGTAQSNEQLPLSLRGSPAGSDTPEIFNVKHLTVAQEAQMQVIAGILNRGSFETAFIFASDVLDLTFVTGYLRQSCPNLRIIVQDWDLLFLQTTTKWSLEGVWMLTSLLPPPQNLRVPERPGHPASLYWTPLLAASQFEHATYDAAYTVFTELFPPTCAGCPDEHNRGNVTAIAEEDKEPIWLSVVGHRGLWPLGALGTAQPRLPANAFSGRLTRLTGLVVWLVLGLTALYQLLVFYSLISPLLPRRLAGLRRPRPFGSFRWWNPGYEGRVGYHSLGVLILGCMSYVLTAPFAGWRIAHLPIAALDRVGLALCVLSLLLSALGGLRLLLPVFADLAQRPGGPLLPWIFSKDRRFALLAAIVTANCVGVLFLTYWRDVVGPAFTLRSYFLALRALDAFSGVSPALPILLLACGFLTLAWTQMRRHELYMRVRPDIPTVFPRINAAFQPSGPAVGPVAILSFLAVALATTLSLFRLFAHQSFDGNHYQGDDFDHLYFTGLSVLWAALVIAVARLYRLWSPLRCLLQTLERAPLRRAFTALPTEFASSPLVPSARRQDHRIMLTRSLDTLRAYASETKSAEEAETVRLVLPRLTRLTERYVRTEGRAHPCAERCFRRIQALLSTQADAIAVTLRPLWGKGMAVREGSEAPPKDFPREVALAEEFLALRYLAVIRYSVSQMWCQVWFLALGFFFAVLSTTAYPFRSQGSIRWMTNLYLCLLGLPVLFIVMQAERNPVLRRLSSNPEGKSGGQFMQLAVRLAVLGALPLLGVINSYVPLLGRLLSTWIEPLASVPK